MRSASGKRVLAALVAACAIVVLGAGSASAAERVLQGLSWGAGVEAVLPADAAEGGGAALESVSCPSAGNCSAVGWYADGSGKTQGLLLTETAGRWAAGVEAVLPANAGASAGIPGAFVRFVSCASAGNCSAVGTYPDSSGGQQGMLLTETDGSWSAGVEAVLPANAVSSGEFVQWGSLSCASPGDCAAVGEYSAVGRFLQALLLTKTNGSWSAGVDAAPASPAAWLGSVSCASAGNCTAVGGFDDSSNVQQGLLLTETAGSWGPPVEAGLPSDNTNLGAELDSVSCASAGNCSAVGLYDASEVFVARDVSEFQGKGLLLTETAGSWATGVGAVLPADAAGPNAVNQTNPPAVSCSSAGNCSAVASYFDSTFGLQGVLLSETAGGWATGVESQGGGFLNSVSCVSPGNCGALVGGELRTETDGTWGSGVETPLPANGGSGALLYSVSCVSDGNCTAVGQYTDSSGHPGALLTGGSPASIALHITKSGTGSGTVSSDSAGIDCGPTCSASFDAGTSLTLTATPSPGSRFSGWSGGGCTGTGSCQVGTGIGEQTVTATFTRLPKCLVPRLKGKPLKTAEHAIRAHNCTVGTIRHAASRQIEKGHVISQKPAPGRRLRHGTKINLVLSRGRR